MYGMEYIIQCETLHFGLGFISAFLVGFVLLRWMLTTYLWGCCRGFCYSQSVV